MPRTVKLDDFWFENYMGHAGLCVLCGNTGIIDTTGTKSPAGVECGRKSWCICPNGEILREVSGGKGP